MTHLTLLLRRTHKPESPFRLMRPLLVRISVALIAAALGLFSPVARSASICRWVDANGRTQMSDVVPDKFKQSATCSDSRKYELSPGQQREAERRVAEQQIRMRDKIAQPPKQAASIAPGTTKEKSLPIAKRPTARTARRGGASTMRASHALAPTERHKGPRSPKVLTSATTFPVLRSSVVHEGTEAKED